MGLVNIKDIDLDSDHDIKIDGSGNVKQSTSFGGLKNVIKFRVQTDIKDWMHDPDFVADLGRFIGESNNEEIGSQIETRVRHCILRDRIVDPVDLSVNVVPISPTEVVLLVQIANIATEDNSGRELTLQFKIDFTSGHIVGII